MILDGQRTDRVLVISSLLFVSIIVIPCHGWHQSLTFVQHLSYDLNSVDNHHAPLDMKFFMWYKSYAIYGARETLILLKPDASNSSVEIFSYKWPIDHQTMDECLQEWSTKDKCYNDVVHVRILPNSTKMNVYCTYAYQPMVRSFDLHSMTFINENVSIRDPHPPMDSESSYVMLTFGTSIVTAGYQGDYIPTIRGTQGKTLLYALRQNSYFVGGFKYDGKAVFGVIETSERTETNRVSRLVMACANRAEIVRKAILNCSTDAFDPSRSFVFHILTSLVDLIHTTNGSTVLYTTFTSNNSSITASAVCLFILDKQFYDVFTGPPLKINPTVSTINSETNELIRNCSQSIPSTIDRDMVESQRQFSSYLSRPLLIDTMSTSRFTAINVIEYQFDIHCLLIGTSNGRLLTAFVDGTFKTNTFEELTLPFDMRHSVKSITHQKVDNNSYVIIITNHLGYLLVKLTSCKDDESKLCFECWFKDCQIRRVSPAEHHCFSEESIRFISLNNTTYDAKNQSSSSNWSATERKLEPRSNNNLLLYIVAPMSVVVFVLSMSIIFLLTKSTRDRRQQRKQSRNHRRKTRHSTSTYPPSHTYTNNVMYRTCNNKLSVETTRNHQQHLFPIKSEVCVRSTSRPVYSTSSTHSLPPLVVSSSQPIITPKSQPLSVHRLYRSYV